MLKHRAERTKPAEAGSGRFSALRSLSKDDSGGHDGEDDQFEHGIPLHNCWQAYARSAVALCIPRDSTAVSPSTLPLHYANLLLRQPVQLIRQGVNLPVGGLDLPLVEFFVGGDGGGG